MSAVEAPPRDAVAPSTTRRDRIAAFVRLGRPRFLVESLLTVALGLAVAVHEGASVDVGPYLLVQAFVTGTHTMTHYCNEYFDREADAAQEAPTAWTGGSRVLARGQLNPEVSLAGAFVLLFAMGALVAAMPDTGSRLAGVAVLALAWFYTAPPIRLNYRGAGEVTTAAVLLLLTPGLTCYLQTRTVPALLVAVTVPLFVVMAARMVVMNLCDHDADRTVGKITIPGLVGPRRAATLYVAAQVGAYGSVVGLTVADVLPLAVGIAVLVTAPASAWMCRRLLAEPIGDAAYANTTALVATLHAAATGYAATVGLIIANIAPGDDEVGPGASVAASAGLLVLYTLLQGAVQIGGRRSADDAGVVDALDLGLADSPDQGAVFGRADEVVAARRDQRSGERLGHRANRGADRDGPGALGTGEGTRHGEAALDAGDSHEPRGSANADHAHDADEETRT